jgi:hypothetical protein
MKTLEQRSSNTPAPRLQAELDTLVAALFRRLPTLMGFSIEDGDELCLVDLETFPWDPQAGDLAGEIAGPLAELIDEAPTALELMRGRTFARAFH